MVKVERKKELLKWFTYGRIKNDISYSTLLKKAGGNGKGFLDRYFILHRNFVIYYKPGKLDSKPDDIQEPQGYINLGDCIYEETKNLSKTQPNTFQISTKVGRTYLIKAKDEKTIEHFLLLVRPRVQSLSNITIASLGNTEENLKTISNLLPRTMKLPDRVKPDLATKWIMEMSEFYESYREWEPYLMKLEQFSEICHGTTKDYVDWFVGPEGPRLSMIRCEELVLDNWSEFIRKASQEIDTYEETRFFSEDFQDIIKHIKNMILLIDSYNLYMRQCRHKTVKYVDKYLEEKNNFLQHLEQYNKIPSMSLIQFGNPSNIGNTSSDEDKIMVQGTIKAIIGLNNSNNNNNNNNSSSSTTPINTSDDNLIPDLSRSGGAIQGSSGEKFEEWRFSNNTLTRTDDGFECWTFSNGFFRNERFGDILWNNKTWLWSHPKTDYKIRFDWDNVSNSFVYYQPKTLSSISLHSSTNHSKLSLSGKRSHPTTVYADWRLSKNIYMHSVVVGNKAKPPISDLQITDNGIVPLPALLIVAMSHHIKESLEQLNIK